MLFSIIRMMNNSLSIWVVKHLNSRGMIIDTLKILIEFGEETFIPCPSVYARCYV